MTFIYYVVYAYTKNKHSKSVLIIHAIFPWVIIIHNFIILFLRSEPYPKLVSDIMFFGLCYTMGLFIYRSEGLAFGGYNKRLLKQRWRKKKLRIGVLNDLGWDITDKKTYAGSDISPTAWKDGFDSKKYQVDLVTDDTDFREYVAIINPYGGVYLESNLETLDSYTEILQFVVGGGVFVNVADIPTYWAYSNLIMDRVDHTETISTLRGEVKPFYLTPLMKALNLKPSNVCEGIDFNYEEFTFRTERVAIQTENMVPILPIVPSTIEGQGGLATMFFIGYGKGDFLINLLWLDQLPDATKTKAREIIIENLVLKLDQKKETLSKGD